MATVAPDDARDPATQLPLPPATFHILLALTGEDRHGYAISQEIALQTDGAVRMSAGTLYRSLQRMVDQGLIEERETRPVPALDDERRRYYRLTTFGRAVTRAEAERLQALIRIARAHGVVPRKA